MAAGRVLALLPHLALAAALILPGAGAITISIRSVDGITVVIKPGHSTQAEKFCKMCTGSSCFPEWKIQPGEQFNFSFACLTPEKYWVLVVEKNIDCMSRHCPFEDVLLQPSGLPNLNRTFIWDVKAGRKDALVLKFATWLRQVDPGDTCHDQVVYKIGSRFDANTVNIGFFCRNGSVSRVKVQGEVIMTLQLPWDSRLNTSGFKIESRDSIKRLCIIESTFLSESSATLMSANYPVGFPEDELMTWQFVVPPTLRASIFFLNHTKPNCERKEQRLEYSLPGYDNPEVYSLTDAQPMNIPGSFNLSLQGCDQDDVTPGALRLLFKVDVHPPKNEDNISFTVDLRREDMNVTFYSDCLQSGSHSQNKPACLICRNARHCGPNVTLASGESSSITILCHKKDISSNVKMMAEKSIACWKSRTCQKRTFALVVPKALLELPVPLDMFIWKLTAPEDTNIELRAPTLKLQQHIPNQQHKCSGSYSYAINGTTPGKTLAFGIYCPGGAIEKIQIRNNVTISLKTFGQHFNEAYWNQDLKLVFMPAMKEDCIFTVTPAPKSKVYLETPNWVDGLPPYMNVYWNISVPKKNTAQLRFVSERMDVSCDKGWAYVYVNEQRPNAEETVRRHDQLLPRNLDMRHNFWLNISNCKPLANHFLSMQFTVTIADKKSDVAIIIGAVAGGLAVLTAIGLAVCCIKKKKKKEDPQTPMVGVYNSNVNTQLPTKPGGVFKKGRKNNESHVYAVIDDTMVYGHLLDNLSGPGNAEVGVYRPFTGPVSSKPPSPPPISSFRKMSKLSTTEESSTPMTDNETYTFAHRALEPLKSNGDTHVSGNGEVGLSLLGKKEPENSVE